MLFEQLTTLVVNAFVAGALGGLLAGGLLFYLKRNTM